MLVSEASISVISTLQPFKEERNLLNDMTFSFPSSISEDDSSAGNSEKEYVILQQSSYIC